MTTNPPAPPAMLHAPDPSWSVRADVAIVGSGIAGLCTALRFVELDPDRRVVIVTKHVVASGSTRWAQGGIAAAVAPGDDPLAHMVDTMVAGRELCLPEAVRTLVTEGPDALRWLSQVGAHFDMSADGSLALTREGGHRVARIAHAGGDATGAEIERALVAAVRAHPRIEFLEHAFVPDLLLGADPARRSVTGVSVHVMGEGDPTGVGAVHAGAVVIAAGGLGQVYAATSNPEVSTGDGVAMGLRAGARIRDLEFVQFHPTVLWLGAEARGQQPLISEAVRGEGAVLRDASGRAFMRELHELGDLAPRDVVARGIAGAMAADGAPYVHLDARHFGPEKWEERFPTILASCRKHGIDPVTECIPVAPAAHYASGGLWTDLEGRTGVGGLYAVGEAACTGVHGANRLASNSLLESVVFAHRAAGALSAAKAVPEPREPAVSRQAGLMDPRIVPSLRALMSRHAGVMRDPEGLRRARGELAELAHGRDAPRPGVESWEATNLYTVAWALLGAALYRESALGDLPQGRHVLVDLTGTGEVQDPEAAACGVEDAVAEPVARALAEDLGGRGARGDVTTLATIPAAQIRSADVVARGTGVVCGLEVAEHVFTVVSRGMLNVERRAADGQAVSPGEVLLRVTARTRDLLTAERTALNFLTHLSGIATATARWVREVEGTGARIRDTRKTHPGLRSLEKYAVLCGGGVNHRFGLADAALIKDNHVAAAGGVAQAVAAVRRAFPEVPLEVEVDAPEQIEPALRAGAEELLLDNFTVPMLTEAVALVAGRAVLEASGGLTLDQARAVAATGVDYLAVGALTHSSPALDIALDLCDGEGL